MKKKNIIWALLAMFVMATFSVGFIACNDDDDDNDNAAVGTWYGIDGSGMYHDEMTLTFKSNGKGTWKTIVDEGSWGRFTEKGTFTYKMEGKSKGYIIMKEDRDDSYSYYSYSSYDSYDDDESDVFYFEIKGQKMYLYEHDYGDDLEWVLTKQ